MRRIWMGLLALLLGGGAAAAHDPLDMVALSARLLPSVVSIAAVKRVDTPAQMGQPAATARKRIMGTGFVIEADGLIVTNRHVVEGASEVTVTLSDGSTLSARVVSMALVDIALLQVQPEKPLAPVTWGNSNALRQGMPVIAIGTPRGYATWLTAGIVSALERDIRTSAYDDYIQTNATINPGHSGGPLFNLQGEVVGVNTAVQSQGDGGWIGIGFAIPSNDAQFVITRLLQFGRVKPGWVGVRVQTLTPAIADGAGMPRAERSAAGVIVTGLDSGGSGLGRLRPGDIVVGVADVAMKDARTFGRSVSALDVGTTAVFDIWRGGVRMTLDIPIIDNPDDIKAGQGKLAGSMANGFVDPPDLGLGLAPLTTEIRGKFGIETAMEGVAVVAVDAQSRASEAGIEPGDVIQRVMTEPVHSVRSFWLLVDGARRERRTRLLLLVRGPSGERWVTLPSA